jgi:hypothetical protein
LFYAVFIGWRWPRSNVAPTTTVRTAITHAVQAIPVTVANPRTKGAMNVMIATAPGAFRIG